MYCMEMASNGYIVFICDHLCGLGRFVQLEGGEVKKLNVDMPHPSDAWPKGEPDNEKIA